jgi:mono/diheme cytochrome c family protein
VETVVAKLRRGLPVASPTVLTYADGNFARDARRADLPQRLLVDGQWLVLTLCLLGVVIVTIRERRGRNGDLRGSKGWIAPVIMAIGLFGAGVLTWAIYELPALSIIPPEKIVEGATDGVFTPDVAGMTREEQALTARGEYLFKVASCAFCHNPNGSGGLKISWRPIGTLWVRNITSDRDTGIGAWTDAAIARAIRSGLTPDGRVLHWQGMIWDHASNWDEEDIRAIVTYLRKIPPVKHAIPPVRPPAPDDCAIYTFWVRPSRAPGCEGQGPL